MYLKYLPALLLSLLTVSSPQAGTSKITPVNPPLRIPSSYHSVVIFNQKTDSGGTACPVGLGAFAFTAKHVAVDDPDHWFDPVTGKKGALQVLWKSEDRDLAKVAIVTDSGEPEFFPHPMAVANSGPYPGDPILSDGLLQALPVIFHGFALQIHPEKHELWVDGSTFPGSSGGCAYSPLPNVEAYGIVLGSASAPSFPTGMRPQLRVEPIWGVK